MDAKDIDLKKASLARRSWRTAIAATALSIFTWMAVLAHERPHFSWDLDLARSIRAIALPGFTTAMSGVSALGDGWTPFALVAIIAISMALLRFRREAIICAAGAGLAGGLNRLLKAVVARPRPGEQDIGMMLNFEHESFPSGHTVFFVSFFGFLILVTMLWVKKRSLRVALLAVFSTLIGMVGISRVHLGAHWPSDVTAGYLLGGIWLGLMSVVYYRYRKVTAGNSSEN